MLCLVALIANTLKALEMLILTMKNQATRDFVEMAKAQGTEIMEQIVAMCVTNTIKHNAIVILVAT